MTSVSKVSVWRGISTYHRRQHAFIVYFECVLSCLLTMGSQVKFELLNTDALVAHRSVFLLQLLSEQEVVASHKIEIAVVEAVKQHHFRERICKVVAAKLEVHSRVFDDHAIFNTSDTSLLGAHVDDACNTEACSESSCERFLDEANPLEAKVDDKLTQDLCNEDFLVQVWNDEDTAVLAPLLLVLQAELLFDAFLNDEEVIAFQDISTLVVLLVEPPISQRPTKFVARV